MSIAGVIFKSEKTKRLSAIGSLQRVDILPDIIVSTPPITSDLLCFTDVAPSADNLQLRKGQSSGCISTCWPSEGLML